MPIGSQPEGVPLRLHEAEGGDFESASHDETTGPMDEGHYRSLSRLALRVRPIEKAVGYARFSGWSTLLAGGCTLVFSFGNTPMLVFSLVLAGLGTRELTLARSLRSLDRKAPGKLAINQLMLGGLLMMYALTKLFSAPAAGVMESAMKADPMLQSTPELSGMFDDLIKLEQVATAAVYVLMIVVALFLQGLTAVYYLLKGMKLRKLHEQAPRWAVRVYQTIHS